MSSSSEEKETANPANLFEEKRKTTGRTSVSWASQRRELPDFIAALIFDKINGEPRHMVLKMAVIAPELKKLLSSFKECDVAYLLADGFTHRPNTALKLSKNLDFWLKPSFDNARRLIRALKIFGTPMHGVQPDQLATPETQFTLSCRPYQLEFYTHIPNLEFDQSFQLRELYREGQLFINLLNGTDLALARASLSRPPDDSDPDAAE